MAKHHIDLGHGYSMIGYDMFEEGIADAIAHGRIICMPRVDNVPQDPGRVRCERVPCPYCKRDCWRDVRIPAEAMVACSECALRLAAKSQVQPPKRR